MNQERRVCQTCHATIPAGTYHACPPKVEEEGMKTVAEAQADSQSGAGERMARMDREKMNEFRMKDQFGTIQEEAYNRIAQLESELADLKSACNILQQDVTHEHILMEEWHQKAVKLEAQNTDLQERLEELTGGVSVTITARKKGKPNPILE